MSMLDNLREEASSSPFFEEEEEDLLGTEVPEQKRDWFAWLGPIRALTPAQRLVLAALIFVSVCLIGSMFLLIVGKFSIVFA